jgi:hypothetical protein
MNCGNPKKDHSKTKPYRCNARSQEQWKPWTLETYQAAQQIAQQAGKAKAGPPKKNYDVTKGYTALAAGAIQLEPDYGFLFRRFLTDATNAGEALARSLREAQSGEERLEAQEARVLRVVQSYVAPVTVCLNSATRMEEIQQLREVMAKALTQLNHDAMQAEMKAEED